MRKGTCNGVGAILLCLAMAACTTEQGTPQPPPQPVHFSCQGHEAITVRFGAGSAVLEAGGTSVAMLQTRTADGFRYAGGGQAIRGKGDELRWHNGKGRDLLCHTVPAP